jgi:adenylate cyclase
VHSSHGYAQVAVGAEVALGEGLIGTVASEKKLLRVSGVSEELRYGRAIRAGLEHTSARRALRAEVPLPGLPDAQSQLAMPLVVGDRLVGVLAVESPQRLGFDDWDEAFLGVVANQVAVAIEHARLRDAQAAREPKSEAAPAAPRGMSARDEAATSAAPALAAATTGRLRRFRFFRNDDCVFVDDDYLIRNVPGRILWKLLRAYHDQGRSEFSNRELRLDASLGLPALRDNLESRVALLRKRLEQKCPELRLLSTSRGHFRLEVSCAVQLEEQDGSA